MCDGNKSCDDFYTYQGFGRGVGPGTEYLRRQASREFTEPVVNLPGNSEAERHAEAAAIASQDEDAENWND